MMKKIIILSTIILVPFMAFTQYKEGINSTNYQASPPVRAVMISPNPGNGLFNVFFIKNFNTHTAMIVYDNTGKEVYVKEHLEANPVRIDLSHLQPGMYFAVFMPGNEKITEKIIIAK